MNTKNNTGLNKLYPSAGNQTAIICQKGADMERYNRKIETQIDKQIKFFKRKGINKRMKHIQQHTCF